MGATNTTPRSEGERHAGTLQEIQRLKQQEAAFKDAMREQAMREHRESLNAMLSRLSLGTPAPGSVNQTRNPPATFSHAQPVALSAKPGYGGDFESSLRTSDITILSHAHGRQRRDERDISKRELQEAIKYGRREPANPGKDGSRRWRFTHKGVIYITDETMRHEITSWRMAEAGAEEAIAAGSQVETGSHTVIVVDSSGSMRKDDVPGYATRTEAVYDCLARDFVEPQLAQQRAAEASLSSKLSAPAATHVVTLIEMSDASTVIFSRRAFDQQLMADLKRRAGSRAHSHGNYVPALDKVLEVLRQDAAHGKQLFLLFLSDGAPSDHNETPCEHGVLVWQPAPPGSGGKSFKGKPALTRCPGGVRCRAAAKQAVRDQCLDRITRLGDLFGRDRTFVGTVAFGPPDEDYEVLQQMAARLPRGSFQKLGLTALHLRTAFSSLTGSLTSLCTDAAAAAAAAGGGGGIGGATPLTQRVLRMERDGGRGTDGWDVYMVARGQVVSKERFDLAAGGFAPAAWSPGAGGVAHSASCFGRGAERVVFHFSEVDAAGRAVGPRLVAKQTQFEELMHTADFHVAFCRVQANAQELARLFNRRVRGPPAWEVAFLDCVVYHVRDPRYPGGAVKVLVEQELEGKFTKWNNNAGQVRAHQDGAGPRPAAPGAMAAAAAEARRRTALGIIGEDSDSDADSDSGGAAEEEVTAGDVPQCFSHFTYEVTEGKNLVCDLQGVWNEADGFTLTDPVIHTSAGRRRGRGGGGGARGAGGGGRGGTNGKTDKGAAGMRLFFSSHTCNALCRRLGLRDKEDLTTS